MRKKIQLILIVCATLSILGIVFGGLAYGYENRSILYYAIAGAFIGAVMAPEIEPKYFRFPKTWQTVFSILGCTLFAHSIEATQNGYAISVLIGLFLGLTANIWVKHVTFP